jgi:hypothetical protein
MTTSAETTKKEISRFLKESEPGALHGPVARTCDPQAIKSWNWPCSTNASHLDGPACCSTADRGDAHAGAVADAGCRRLCGLASPQLRMGRLLAQHEQGELERTQQLQNRIRLLPSSREVQRMEAAISWPAQHLAQLPPLLVAVNTVSLVHALDRDVGWVANKRGGYADTWRQRYDEGCSIIALGLRACRSPVF